MRLYVNNCKTHARKKRRLYFYSHNSGLQTSCYHSRKRSYIIVNRFLKIPGNCSVVKKANRILRIIRNEEENETESLIISLNTPECCL